MGRLEVQGIVSAKTGEPLVQVRQIDDESNQEYGFQCTPMEAREMAQNFVEAASNAVYDAAIIGWAKENWPNDEVMAWAMVSAVREFRADKWGLPDKPEDWR